MPRYVTSVRMIDRAREGDDWNAKGDGKRICRRHENHGPSVPNFQGLGRERIFGRLSESERRLYAQLFGDLELPRVRRVEEVAA